MSYQDEALPRLKWFSWLTDSLTVAASKAQAKLDESRNLRDRLSRLEETDFAIRKALTKIEKLVLDPRFTLMRTKTLRIKLLQIIDEVDE